MDTDKAFVWFVYVSLAVAVVLMIATVLPTGTGPDEGPSGPDGDDGGEVPAGDASDGAADGDAADDNGNGTVDDADGASDRDGPAVQNETGDPVTVSGATNESTDTTENGTRRFADLFEVETAVIQQINARRRDAYVPSLESIYLDELWTIAERHTGDMVGRGYFALESPDGTDKFRRFTEAEPPCTRIDNYHRAYMGIARVPYSPWTNDSAYRTQGTIGPALVRNYTDADAEFEREIYDDIGIDLRFDEDGGYLVSTVTMC